MNRLFAFGLLSGALLIHSGCGASSGGGDYEEAVAQGTAPLAIVDLQTHAIEYRTDIDDLETNPVYRDQQMVFRRLNMGNSEIFVAVFELTQGQWNRVAGTTPWNAISDNVCSSISHTNNHPAYNISLEEVGMATVNYALPGTWHFDLPNDAEWTAACGATTTASMSGTVARESVVNPTRLAAGNGMDTSGPLAAGSRSINDLGFYDLLGNVWEWTKNGSARGGSWMDPLQLCQCAVQISNDDSASREIDHVLIGARLVLRP